MDSQPSPSSSNSTPRPESEYPYYPYLASDLRSRNFVPPDALLTTALRLPKDWHTNDAARTAIDVIRNDSTFQATAKGYIQASNGSGELDQPPRRLYDGMLQRIFELTHIETGLPRSRAHFLVYSPCDEWLDRPPQVVKERKSPDTAKDSADGTDSSEDDDENDVDEELEAEIAAHRHRKSIQCASMAMDRLMLLRPYSVGLLISPRKAQLLYYDRSIILVSEAFDIFDTEDQPTDILIIMLLSFSVMTPRGDVFFSGFVSL